MTETQRTRVAVVQGRAALGLNSAGSMKRKDRITQRKGTSLPATKQMCVSLLPGELEPNDPCSPPSPDALGGSQTLGGGPLRTAPWPLLAGSSETPARPAQDLNFLKLPLPGASSFFFPLYCSLFIHSPTKDELIPAVGIKILSC